ncbi:MAG: type II toxin-antitoxin system PemK/MazF family toxin [Opitutaceae bacterium]|nr:type II toxin-antitoxin system PemK/MazF family toxin [Opitutaceae bacterium]
MSLPLKQWDVVKVRINPGDRDEHPALVISADEVCASAPRINVLYGSTRRPGQPVRPHQIVLNSAEGLDRATLFSCGHFYQVAPGAITGHFGNVSPVRRREISRKIIAAYRLTL